ncbi:MAG: prepilin-type N-terminal cleavage/methylation domain-containing protein [Planctomycetes bacterium]|nr:prepilin-type N-terminal cleavage/methylation domain-containing protein [Planctomycetota bacterium]
MTALPTHRLTSMRRDAGLSLIEVTIALSISAVGALALFATMGTASHADSGAKRRSVALHAAHTIIQDVAADADTMTFNDFLTQWNDPANQVYQIEGLENPNAPGGNALAVVAIDQADPNRIGVSVTISWLDHGRTEQFVLPYTITEIER